jgi:hypothetical protein
VAVIQTFKAKDMCKYQTKVVTHFGTECDKLRKCAKRIRALVMTSNELAPMTESIQAEKADVSAFTRRAKM